MSTRDARFTGWDQQKAEDGEESRGGCGMLSRWYIKLQRCGWEGSAGMELETGQIYYRKGCLSEGAWVDRREVMQRRPREKDAFLALLGDLA